MADLKRETRMTLCEGDVCDILTEALCRYGPLDELRVEAVARDASSGDFHLTLMPPPVKESA